MWDLRGKDSSESLKVVGTTGGRVLVGLVGRPGLDPGTLGLKGRRRLINTSQASVKSGNRRPFSSDVSDESSPYAAVRGLKWGPKVPQSWLQRVGSRGLTATRRQSQTKTGARCLSWTHHLYKAM
jgi:hypothetical protein